MRYVAVYNGVFAETLHGVGFNFLKMCYFDKRTIEVYGDEFTLFEATSVPDTAKYTVESVFDPEAPTHLCISAQTVTVHHWKSILEKVTGKPWTVEQKGSASELATRWKQEMQTLGFGGFLEWMPRMYKSNMYLGQGRHSCNHVERYPAVKPTSIEDFLRANLSKLTL